jgi:hypothetical protein
MESSTSRDLIIKTLKEKSVLKQDILVGENSILIITKKETLKPLLHLQVIH